jgi:hypothetical protein
MSKIIKSYSAISNVTPSGWQPDTSPRVYQFVNQVDRFYIRISDETNNSAPLHKVYDETDTGLFSVQLNDSNFAGVRNINGNRIEFNNLYYDVETNKLKESVVFASKPVNNYVEYTVKLENNTYFVIHPVTKQVRFYRNNEENKDRPQLIAAFEHPFCIDNSSVSFHNVELETTYLPESDLHLFRYIIDSEWLNSAVYPVIFDPSVTLFPTYSDKPDIASRSIVRTADGHLGVVSYQSEDRKLYFSKADVDDFSRVTHNVVFSLGAGWMYTPSVAVTPVNGYIYISVENDNADDLNEVYKSTDHGATWSLVWQNTGLSNQGTYVCADSSNRLFNAAGRKTSGKVDFRYTDDAAQSWVDTATNVARWYPVCKFNWHNGKVLLVGSQYSNSEPQLAHYDPATNTWDTVLTVPTTNYVTGWTKAYVQDAVIDNNNIAYIYVAVRDSSNIWKYLYEHVYDITAGTVSQGTFICTSQYASAIVDSNGDRHLVAGDSQTNKLWYQKNGGALEVLRDGTAVNDQYLIPTIEAAEPWQTPNGTQLNIACFVDQASGWRIEHIDDKAFTAAGGGGGSTAKIFVPMFFGM